MSEELKQEVAKVVGTLGYLIQQFPLGEHRQNLELGITCHKIMLTVFSRDQQPEMWGTIQHNLAVAYYERIKGERKENIEVAIATYKSALGVYTLKAFPKQWAIIQNNLANVYRNRVKGE